jgi:hypothetical protein
MATAKQIAWRKKFAAMAKSGHFHKKKRRANPSRVTRRIPGRRAKNPAPPTSKHVFIATRSKRKALAEAQKRGIQHPIANKVHGGFTVYQAYEDKKKLQSNPLRFHVNIGVAGNRMHKIAEFRDKPRAIEYAKALHKKSGRRVSVTH